MKRKPNWKTWECPIFGKICNTRGVPTYVRNKLGLPWDAEYLNNKDKLKEDYQLKISNQMIITIKKVIIDNQINEEDKEECNEVIKKSLIDLLWAINFSYKNDSTHELSDMLRYIKNYTGRERKKYFNRYRNNADHGIGTDLFS